MPAGMRVPNAHELMFMSQWDPNAESLLTGISQNDHDGGPTAHGRCRRFAIIAYNTRTRGQ